jgi:hypothetical protein
LVFGGSNILVVVDAAETTLGAIEDNEHNINMDASRHTPLVSIFIASLPLTLHLLSLRLTLLLYIANNVVTKTLNSNSVGRIHEYTNLFVKG